MTEAETRLSAALNEMKVHLDTAQNRAINLAADLAVAKEKIAAFEKALTCNTPSSPSQSST